MFVEEGANLGAGYDEEQGFVTDEDGSGNDEFNPPALFELTDEYSFAGHRDEIVTVDAWPLEDDVEQQVLANQGLDSQREVDEFMF